MNIIVYTVVSGCIILLGRTNMFRYNDPVEAAKLRKEGSRSHLNLSRLSLLSWSTPDLNMSLENLHIRLVLSLMSLLIFSLSFCACFCISNTVCASYQ